MVDPTPFFWIGTAGMALGTLAFLRAFVVDPKNRLFHAILAFISGFAFVAYLTMSLGAGAIQLGGGTLYVARYVDWLVTTPLLIVYLGLLSGISRRSMAVMVLLDVVMIVTGIVAFPLEGVLKFVVFGISSVAFVGIVWGLTSGITEAVTERPSAVRAMFHKLRNLTVAVWLVYPILWLIGTTGFGIVDPAIEALLYTYADLIAKVGFGLIALNSQRALDDLPNIDTVSRLKLG